MAGSIVSVDQSISSYLSLTDSASDILERLDELVQRVVKTEKHFNIEVTHGYYLIRNELGLFSSHGRSLTCFNKFIILKTTEAPNWIAKYIQSQLLETPTITYNEKLRPQVQSHNAIASIIEEETEESLTQIEMWLRNRNGMEGPKNYRLWYQGTLYIIHLLELQVDYTRFHIKYPRNLPEEVIRVLKIMAANNSSDFCETDISPCD